MKKITKNEKGFAVLEMLIAMAIMVLSVSSVILLISTSQSTTLGSQTNQEALYMAQQKIESARSQAKADFSIDQNCDDASATKCTIVPSTFYSVKLTDALRLDLDPTGFTKQLTSLITWGSKHIELATLITKPGGNYCSSTLSGDWTAPQPYGYIDFPSPNGGSSVQVRGGKAYVTSDPNSAGTDDFYIADVSNTYPGKGTLPTLGHFSTTYGLTDINLAGNYAFVTADSTANQLLVIDISSDAVDTSKIKKKIDVTAGGDTATGNSIYIDKNILYLGLTKSSGNELHIFDISNPTNPTELGTGYETGTAINNINVRNNVAYLAVANNAANQELIELDVTTPSAPSFIRAYNSSALFGQVSVLDGNANNLYFGRTGASGNPRLIDFDPANLTTPKWSYDMSYGIYTMILRGGLLYMTTGDPNDGLQIWDISGGGPSRYDTNPLNIQQGATAGADCYGNLLYIAQRSNRALQVVGPYVVSSYVLSNSGNLAVTQGSSVNNTIIATVNSGYSQKINFNVSGLPAGATAILNPTGCSPGCSTQLTINTISTTPVGNYTITVSATGNTTPTTFKLKVNAKAIPTLSADMYNAANNLIITTVPHNTTMDVYTKVTAGGSLGTPTGTVTFAFYKSSGDCSTGGTSNSTDLLNSGVAKSSTSTTQKNKDSSYLISYPGDNNYSAASVCKTLLAP